jgi:glucokinase
MAAPVREMILAGDIGGTKSNLALYSIQGEELQSVFQQSFPSKDYPALEPLVQEFISGKEAAITKACFGIAGPIVNDKVKTPNLPWVIDARAIARCLKLDLVLLINDLEAAAYGILKLSAGEFATLNSGLSQEYANRAVIAAGTGLGEAILYWDGSGHRPFASEGGHADFAPRTPLQLELLRHLMARFDHVSYERVISGPGLFSIYNFLKESERFAEPRWLAEKLRLEDPGAVISEVALAEQAEICVKALDLFTSIYGAEAGNLALKAKAVGGIYVGGGIAPKILAKLSDDTFMRAFADKGRFKDFLSAIPVKVVLNEQAALRGAGYYAAFHSGSTGK